MPLLHCRLRQLAAGYGVDWDAADTPQRVALGESMFQHSNAQEPPEVRVGQCSAAPALGGTVDCPRLLPTRSNLA